jgi:hypothetical protein
MDPAPIAKEVHELSHFAGQAASDHPRFSRVGAENLIRAGHGLLRWSSRRWG